MNVVIEFADRLFWAALQGLAMVLVVLWLCRWRGLASAAKVWMCRVAWLKLAVGPVACGTVVFFYSDPQSAKSAFPSAGMPFHWLATFLVGVWAIGLVWEVVLLFQRSCATHRWLLKAKELDPDPAIASLSRRLGLGRTPKTASHRQLAEPCVAGTLRPRLLLPKGFDPGVDPLATAHELCHLKHGDLAWTGLALLVQAIYWFLPGSSALMRETALWQEARADAEARRALGASPAEMARRVLAAASGRPLFGLSFGAAETERRIRALLEPRPAGPAMLLGIVLGLAGMVPVRLEARPNALRRQPDVAAPVAGPFAPVRIAGPVGG